MIHSEDILFVMPEDREMQFPAMAAMQTYVNCYEQKMLANCVFPKPPEYRFRYDVLMRESDWQLFIEMGIALRQSKESIGAPDAVIDLSDDRLRSFFNSGKHCSQVCSAIAGVECPPLPQLRRIEPDYDLRMIYAVDEKSSRIVQSMESAYGILQYDSGVMAIRPCEVGCVIGEQSWQTYAAAAMGLPVVEILPRQRGVNWLSKWANPTYRLVEEDCTDRIEACLRNIKEVLQWQLQQVQAHRAAQDATKEVSLSTVATAASM